MIGMYHFAIPGGGEVRIALLQTRNAEELFRLEQRNWERLAPWMPFIAAGRSLQDVQAFIRAGLERFGSERGLSAGIWCGDELAGWAGMRVHEDGYATLGYWVDSGFEGKGLATKAVEVLTGYVFDVLRLDRVEIRCEPGNARSIAVAERAGFVREGLLRDAIRAGGELQDLVLYARLRRQRAGDRS